ncbi:MAG: hypothetical protein K8R18_07280 [Parvibaculum sp.]|uniref:hypothetical protein n=1 Tax=Parvibaculum sp. TaxID=2024848 RepID=UPI0025F0802F|nr:hypothetical protein [Parvibaculum sp.]MCE9649410.1 hypothetical protein [Parvibaculum sp.]
MSEDTAFELSRAYAAGWNAAKKNLSDDPEAARNPHPTGEAHQRWADGYSGALESRNAGKMSRKG